MMMKKKMMMMRGEGRTSHHSGLDERSFLGNVWKAVKATRVEEERGSALGSEICSQRLN